MKNVIKILILLVSNLLYAQLDNIHYLQPITSPNANTAMTEEYVYLSTPSTSEITVEVRHLDGVSIPILAVAAPTAKKDVGEVVTTGEIKLSNSNPVRIRFLSSSDLSSFFVTGKEESPVTPHVGFIGRIISANEKIGLKFKSENNFYVNYRAKSTSQAATMLTKGKQAMGKRFHWLGVPTITSSIGTADLNAILTVTALENDTSVTLYPKNTELNLVKGTSDSAYEEYTPGSSYTVSLDEGESFIFVAKIANNDTQKKGWLGSEVSSDKNIIVSSGNLLQTGHASNNRDISLDQIVPVDLLGTTYVALKGNGNTTMESVYVTATENETTFETDSSSAVYTLNKGETYTIPGDRYGSSAGWLRITSNKKVYVSQKVYGSTNGVTSNFMIIPPLSCNGQTVIDNIPRALTIGESNFTTNSKIMLLYRTSMANSTYVYVNGTSVAHSKQVDDVATDWSFRIYNITNGNIKIESEGTIQGQLLGASSAAGYGNYFSGFGIPELYDVEVDYKRFENVCTGDTGTSILKTFVKNVGGTIQWYKGFEEIVDGVSTTEFNKIEGATAATYTIPDTDTEPAEYKMVLTLLDGCSYYSESIKTVKCPCSKEPNKAPGVLYPGIVGVSTTENTNANWPNNVNNAFLTLKSNDKGLVITRNADPETTITEPVEGMIVYDTDDNCYKLFDGTIWKCLRKKCYDYDN